MKGDFRFRIQFGNQLHNYIIYELYTQQNYWGWLLSTISLESEQPTLMEASGWVDFSE